MKRPTKCPLCGSKITKVMNATTKNFYYRCSNHKCRFVLGAEYTEAEYYLQGQTLQTGCINCGESLTVVNGPSGLYARCFNCNCDTRPTSYNGKMYPKWVNSNRKNVKEELQSLINEFEASKNSEDIQYDFDAFIAVPSEQKIPVKKETFIKPKGTLLSSILEVLQEDLNKPMGASEIGTTIDSHVNSVRTSLLSLRTLGLVKIVSYIENPTGNHTMLYQVTESPLPELKTYTKEEGYSTIASFLKDNIDKYGSIVRAKEVLIKGLKDNNVKAVLFNSKKGICSGYPISVMEKIMKKQPVQTSLNFEEKAVTPAMRGSREEGKAKILKIFQKDTTIPYTMSQIAKIINANKCYTKALIKDLRKDKKLKVVGWDPHEGQPGAIALQYQVTESALPRFKTTVDNNLYVTFKQFYRKKLSGKRVTSMSEAFKKIQNLPVIPLIINQRAYAGYSISDLKETFKKYIETPSTSVKRIKKAKKTTNLKNIDVETAVMISQETKEVHSRVSNPLPKKKSLFSSLSSLFKKEEVHS